MKTLALLLLLLSLSTGTTLNPNLTLSVDQVLPEPSDSPFGLVQNAFTDFVASSSLFNANPSLVLDMQQNILDSGGCKLNLCFALDGSAAVGEENFDAQREFVGIVSFLSGLTGLVRLAGTQYGLINRDITKLTEDPEEFLGALIANEFSNSPFSFMSAGIGFCVNQLDDEEVQDDLNVIVVLGDGKTNFGDLDPNGPLFPGNIAKDFREASDNNFVVAVAVDFEENDLELMELITGDPNLVLPVDAWILLLFILVLLFAIICLGVPLP